MLKTAVEEFSSLEQTQWLSKEIFGTSWNLVPETQLKRRFRHFRTAPATIKSDIMLKRCNTDLWDVNHLSRDTQG
jgi:hypothetical protein